MKNKEKIGRIEEVVKLNNLYVREMWKTLKLLAKNSGINAGSIMKITKVLMDEIPEEKPEVGIKEKMKDYVGRMFQ